jgi:hypothetical protein
MPKKRKARRPNIPLHTGPVATQPSAPATPARGKASASASAPVARQSGAASATQIKADYTHVVGDLKRIAMLGGGLIAILVILSFFLR